MGWKIDKGIFGKKYYIRQKIGDDRGIGHEFKTIDECIEYIKKKEKGRARERNQLHYETRAVSVFVAIAFATMLVLLFVGYLSLQ